MADNAPTTKAPEAVSITGHATVYNYFCNQPYKDGPFGSPKTSTGSDSLHSDSKDNQFTGARLEGSKGVLKHGDVVLARNNTNGKQILLVIDDDGAGDKQGALVDVAEGPATQALGFTKVSHYQQGAQKGGVSGAEGAQNMTFTKVGEVKAGKYQETIERVAEINTARDAEGKSTGTIADLNKNGELVTMAANVQADQKVDAAEVAVTKAYSEENHSLAGTTRRNLNAGGRDIQKTEEENQKDRENRMMAALKDMDPEAAIAMVFLAFVLGVVTGKDVTGVLSNFASNPAIAPEKREEYRRSAESMAQDKYDPNVSRRLAEASAKASTGLPDVPVGVAKSDAKNLTIDYNGHKIDVVKNGELQALNDQDTARFILYVNKQAADTRAGMTSDKGAALDIAHFTAGKYEGTETQTGVSETMRSAYMALNMLPQLKERGIKPYVVQEYGPIRQMIKSAADSGVKPDFHSYGMQIRADALNDIASKHEPGKTVGISIHGNGIGREAVEGAFGLPSNNAASQEYAATVMGAMKNSGAFVRGNAPVVNGNATGLQRLNINMPFVLVETGNYEQRGAGADRFNNVEYIAKETNGIVSGMGVTLNAPAPQAAVTQTVQTAPAPTTTAVAPATTAAATATTPAAPEKIDMSREMTIDELPPLTAKLRENIQKRATESKQQTAQTPPVPIDAVKDHLLTEEQRKKLATSLESLSPEQKKKVIDGLMAVTTEFKKPAADPARLEERVDSLTSILNDAKVYGIEDNNPSLSLLTDSYGAIKQHKTKEFAEVLTSVMPHVEVVAAKLQQKAEEKAQQRADLKTDDKSAPKTGDANKVDPTKAYAANNLPDFNKASNSASLA